MNDLFVTIGRWQLHVDKVRDQVYRASTPQERERWPALWLLARGWSAAQVAEPSGRDAHKHRRMGRRLPPERPGGTGFRAER